MRRLKAEFFDDNFWFFIRRQETSEQVVTTNEQLNYIILDILGNELGRVLNFCVRQGRDSILGISNFLSVNLQGLDFWL